MSNLFKLPIEVVTAFIALFGVGLSVYFSWRTSLKTSRVEIQKLRVQLRQAYATKVIETRIAIYPKLYCHLSELSKRLETCLPSRGELEELRERSIPGILIMPSFSEKTRLTGATNSVRCWPKQSGKLEGSLWLAVQRSLNGSRT